MRNYELTLILGEKITSTKKKSVQELVEKIVNTLKGKVVKVEDWGEKEFASPINKNTSGIFLHFKLELDGNSAKQLVIKLKSEEGFLRYLLVRI